MLSTHERITRKSRTTVTFLSIIGALLNHLQRASHHIKPGTSSHTPIRTTCAHEPRHLLRIPFLVSHSGCLFFAAHRFWGRTSPHFNDGTQSHHRQGDPLRAATSIRRFAVCGLRFAEASVISTSLSSNCYLVSANTYVDTITKGPNPIAGAIMIAKSDTY